MDKLENALKFIAESFNSANAEEVDRHLAETVVAVIMNATGMYICPVRRKKQWMWVDKEVIGKSKICCECGERIGIKCKCVYVNCGGEHGYRCGYCHKISLEYCAPLGHLRETVRKKQGYDYVTGKSVEV